MKVDRVTLQRDFERFRAQKEKDTGVYFSLERMSELANMSRSTLWRVFYKPEIEVKLGTIVDICRLIGKPIDEYLIKD